jgi:outer membrane biosynthesis protein TonB
VKNKIQTLSSLATLAISIGLISWGGTLNAQTTPSTPSDQPTPQTQSTPDTPPAQQPSSQPTPSTPEPPTATSPAPPPSQTPTDSTSTPSSQTPADSTPQTPSTSPSTPSTNSTPDQSTPTSGAKTSTSDSQVFAGTVEKSGDKYMLKDDTGKTYDIDHQDDVAKFEGKRVRIQGTLDASGNKILVK